MTTLHTSKKCSTLGKLGSLKITCRGVDTSQGSTQSCHRQKTRQMVAHRVLLQTEDASKGSPPGLTTRKTLQQTQILHRKQFLQPEDDCNLQCFQSAGRGRNCSVDNIIEINSSRNISNLHLSLQQFLTGVSILFLQFG